AQYAQQRQHVERVDQVRQRLGGVVDLHRPAQVIFQVVGDLHHVRCFDDPLAATGRNEEAEDRRVHAHQQRVVAGAHAAGAVPAVGAGHHVGVHPAGHAVNAESEGRPFTSTRLSPPPSTRPSAPEPSGAESNVWAAPGNTPSTAADAARRVQSAPRS
nr:hypothetical protein [Tanacetum cinerariifolium]